MRTYMAKPTEVERKWYVIDAAGKPLGRVASQAAAILRGKHKPTYTPNVDCGDYVIVINADKIEITGDQDNKKSYFSHSMYPGGLRVRTTRVMREQYTVEWVEKAIKGMLPHNTQGANQLKRLRTYKGAEHKQAAQKPEVYEF